MLFTKTLTRAEFNKIDNWNEIFRKRNIRPETRHLLYSTIKSLYANNHKTEEENTKIAETKDKKPIPKFYFDRLDMSGFNLPECCFIGSNFYRTDLRGSNLMRSDLKGASFSCPKY